MSEVNAVGASIAPLESDEKLSGRAQYIADLQRPGLLHAAIVQSPHAHARIKGYDLKAALALPGVRAIVTGDDFEEAHRMGAFIKDEHALAKGKVDKAISLAEGVVASNPREAAYRALLGNAYLRAGRFESAAQAFNDAMKLGDNSTRTALALSLAQIGAGRNRDAVAILQDWRDAIPAADLGLALALAGESGRGVAILSDAVRAGDNSPHGLISHRYMSPVSR